jgi:CheY-like chemotaxis protein
MTPAQVQQLSPVLLVEDNRTHREVALAALEKYGFRVVMAGDGEEALMRLVQEPFSLVLMDIELPWLNGIAAAARIHALKQAGSLADIPVIALTADPSAQTHQRCLDAGMRDVIPKHIWKPRWEALILEKLAVWVG